MNKTKPMYLVGGGNWRNPLALVPILKTIFSETGSPHPQVAYIGAANGDSRSFLTTLRGLFKTAGAKQVTPANLAKTDANVAKAKLVLEAADAVFVSGGDVEEGMRWLAHHGLGPHLRQLYDNGVLFFGISAGSIMLGHQWVRWADPDDDTTATLFPCLGLAPMVCDTHAEDDDWEELKAAVKLLGDRGVGYGIPSGGAIRIGSEGDVAALGKSAVRYENRGGKVNQGADLPPAAAARARLAP